MFSQRYVQNSQDFTINFWRLAAEEHRAVYLSSSPPPQGPVLVGRVLLPTVRSIVQCTVYCTVFACLLSYLTLRSILVYSASYHIEYSYDSSVLTMGVILVRYKPPLPHQILSLVWQCKRDCLTKFVPIFYTFENKISTFYVDADSFKIF